MFFLTSLCARYVWGGQLWADGTELHLRSRPPFTPDTNSASLFGTFQQRCKKQQHVNPQLLPPRALCRTEHLDCGLQVGPHMVGLESHESPCGAAEPQSSEKGLKRFARVVDRRVLTPTICLPRLPHSTVLANVDKMNRKHSILFTLVL